MTAWSELGATGIHRSSQISTPSVNPFIVRQSNSRFVPNGTLWPAHEAAEKFALSAGQKYRAS